MRRPAELGATRLERLKGVLDNKPLAPDAEPWDRALHYVVLAGLALSLAFVVAVALGLIGE